MLLPKQKTNEFRLICAMQKSIYHLLEKKGGINSMVINLMNEERRKIKELPPLSVIDYNCIDRAAKKVRMVLDCLQIDRRMSGFTLVPRNLKYRQRLKKYFANREEYMEIAKKMGNLSLKLIRLIGLTIEYDTHINPNAA